VPSVIKGKNVGRSEIADLFGVGESTVDQWVRKGMPVVEKGSRGVKWQINTAQVSEWLKSRAVEEITGKFDATDERELRRRKLAAETAKAEIELAKIREEVADVADIEKQLTELFTRIKKNLRNIPNRAALSLVGEKDETKIKSVILQEIDATLQELADG